MSTSTTKINQSKLQTAATKLFVTPKKKYTMSNAALGAIRRYSRTTAARVTIDWYVV